jgi:glycerol kinase
MARSAWFSQRLADLTGVRVGRANYQETTALGAALFAGVGSGLFSSVEEAAKARPKVEPFAPAMAAQVRDDAYARWLEAVRRVRSQGPA